MPPAAAPWRAHQLATLSGKSHEWRTSAEWLDAVEAALASAASPREQANAREMKRRFERASRIPTELVKREEALTSRARGVWAGAREASDFPQFAPVLEEKWYPRAQAHFPSLAFLSLDDFMRHVLRSEFSFIRVEADEATYDLHILLRFDLERRLVNGGLNVAEVPDAWNEAFHELSGQRPPDDRRGCLQDIHWSMGGLGYFPTYTLGNLHAAQLFAASQAVPQIADSVKSADYAPLLRWLQEKVHSHGATIEPSEIIRLATGTEPSAEAHLQHLRDRYLT